MGTLASTTLNYSSSMFAWDISPFASELLHLSSNPPGYDSVRLNTKGVIIDRFDQNLVHMQ